MTREDATPGGAAGASCKVAGIVYGLILIAVGAVLVIGGARLIMLGGSIYYAAAGVLAAASGLLVIRGRWRAGAALYLLLMVGTLAWSLWESGLNGWALAPRLISPAVLGLPFLFLALIAGGRMARLGAGLSVAAGVAVVVAAANAASYQPAPAFAARPAPLPAAADDGEWPRFSRALGGGSYSPLAQINTGNAGQLKVAWQTFLGPLPAKPATWNQAQPVKVGDSLYLCTPLNDVVSLDPATGKVRWTHKSGTSTEGLMQAKCRGVAYYQVPNGTGLCAARIIAGTMDGRLLAVDAATGASCPGFGENGVVNLRREFQMQAPGYYALTSAPLVVRGKVVVGSGVADGQTVGEPSGVIRAFDAVTGQLAWAWDLGNPANRAGPKPGEFYTAGTPNAWGPMSADDTLGLVYFGLGNATPDYWAGHRTPEMNKYNASLVALDVETGEPRWHFQTVRYDVWDYDLSAQPVLFDLPTAAGVVPVVVQSGKRGQIFILDRRDGRPVFPVEDRPAPQAGALEKMSPTQPWSPALPDLGGPRLTESMMWGVTAVDQLWCRIKFREARYEGAFTPPGLTPSIADPGYTGGVNWASASIDPARALAFYASNRVVNYNRLITRADADARGLKPDPSGNRGGPVAQAGTPYGADIQPFLSPLKAPCQQPPHGLINAIDLKTGKMVWSRPVGSARDLGPLNKPSRLPITIGTPTFGGPMSSAGGVVFMGATRDHGFRIFDSETGKILFQADLPHHAPTTPMTYLDASGRQIVAISSNATRDGQAFAAVTAFALK